MTPENLVAWIVFKTLATLSSEDLLSFLHLPALAANTALLLKNALLSMAQDIDAFAHAAWPVMKKGLAVACGGSLGAAGRYSVGLFSARRWGASFPWGTLIVNMTGCFLIGLVFALVESAYPVSEETRLFFFTGFLGAFTTFSSFSLETVVPLQKGAIAASFWNVFANTVGGICLTLSGLWLGRMV